MLEDREMRLKLTPEQFYWYQNYRWYDPEQFTDEEARKRIEKEEDDRAWFRAEIKDRAGDW